MVATAMALIVGKAVLVADVLLPFMRRSDNAPMIRPILFKTVIYWAVVFVARFLEGLVEYLIGGGTLGELPQYVVLHFSWCQCRLNFPQKCRLNFTHFVDCPD